MDYLLLILSLATALLGIFGDTWDKNKVGIQKITRLGVAVITILFLSFAFAISSAYQKNKEFATLKVLVYNKIELGIWDILSPLNLNGPIKDTANYFNQIKDTIYLSKLYSQSLFNPLANSTTSITHPFLRDSIRIKKGEDLLNSAIDNYHDVLDSKTMQAITSIFLDEYYSTYTLSRNHQLILNSFSVFNNDTILFSKKQNLAFSTYGSFYKDGKQGMPSYQQMLVLIKKIEELYKLVKK